MRNRRGARVRSIIGGLGLCATLFGLGCAAAAGATDSTEAPQPVAAPEDTRVAAIDRCLAGMDAANGGAEAGTLFARGCAELHRETRCSEAWYSYQSVEPDERVGAIAGVCGKAYCPKISDTMDWCAGNAVDDVAAAKAWHALEVAILAEELGLSQKSPLVQRVSLASTAALFPEEVPLTAIRLFPAMETGPSPLKVVMSKRGAKIYVGFSVDDQPVHEEVLTSWSKVKDFRVLSRKLGRIKHEGPIHMVMDQKTPKRAVEGIVGSAVRAGYGDVSLLSEAGLLARAKAKASKTGVNELNNDTIEAVLTEQGAGFRHCYERERRRTPELRGRIIVEFEIGKDGHVTSSEVVDATLDDANVQGCVLRHLKHLQFERPSGDPVKIKYPFVFSARG